MVLLGVNYQISGYDFHVIGRLHKPDGGEISLFPWLFLGEAVSDTTK
jgi:hypothetical protein